MMLKHEIIKAKKVYLLQSDNGHHSPVEVVEAVYLGEVYKAGFPVFRRLCDDYIVWKDLELIYPTREEAQRAADNLNKEYVEEAKKHIDVYKDIISKFKL